MLVFDVFSFSTVFLVEQSYLPLRKVNKRKKETGKKDKHTKIVIKFVWLSDYIGKNPVDEQLAFSTAPVAKLATCS